MVFKFSFSVYNTAGQRFTGRRFNGCVLSTQAGPPGPGYSRPPALRRPGTLRGRASATTVVLRLSLRAAGSDLYWPGSVRVLRLGLFGPPPRRWQPSDGQATGHRDSV
jgi:hypothetical protein